MYKSALALTLVGAAPALAATPPELGPAPALRAPIALLVDLSAGQDLAARNPDQRMLPASVTKAMSALVAFELIARGRLSENQLITVRPETARRWAGKGTTLALRPGEQVTVHDLLLGMTTVSANDAAAALAEGALGGTAAWSAAMNDQARQLGMIGSHFETPNGFPDHRRTYVTARDLVRLAAALISRHPALYARYIGHPSFTWHGRLLASHDPFAGVVVGADGIKTGHSFEAGFNFLGAVTRGGRRLVVVIGGAPTESGRAAAARALIEWGFARWELKQIAPPRWIAGEAPVQGGSARRLALIAAAGVQIAVPRGSNPALSARIVYTGPLRAPIAQGTEVARLVISQARQPDHSIPLTAARAVSRAGRIDRLTNGLLSPWR